MRPHSHGVCSCSYPRCFGGKLVSDFKVARGACVPLRTLAGLCYGVWVAVGGKISSLQNYMPKAMKGYHKLMQKKHEEYCQNGGQSL